MKKQVVFGLIASMVPLTGFAESPRIAQLMREKQSRIERLEKCMGTTKGLKIAGISTLGLTAVGVAGNIAEASAIKQYDSQIKSTENKIQDTKVEIEEKRAAQIAKEEREQKRLENIEESKKQSQILRNIAMADINAIKNGGDAGSKAVSHGYVPERLPDNLRNQFADAMIVFIKKCRTLIKTNGIRDVSLSASAQENWKQYLGQNPLSEDYVLSDLNEHIIAECKITQCDTPTYELVNDAGVISCIKKSDKNASGTQSSRNTTNTTVMSNKTDNNGSKESVASAVAETGNNDKTSVEQNCVYENTDREGSYQKWNGVEFCGHFSWQDRDITSGLCSKLSLSLCEYNILQDKTEEGKRWICASDCSVIPDDANSQPAFLH